MSRNICLVELNIGEMLPCFHKAPICYLDLDSLSREIHCCLGYNKVGLV